jgi:hypothetical protein
VAQEPELNEKQKAEQNREEDGRDAGADGEMGK